MHDYETLNEDGMPNIRPFIRAKIGGVYAITDEVIDIVDRENFKILAQYRVMDLIKFYEKHKED